MMELKERKQVVKDLQEIVDNYSGSWQRFNVLDGALTLIKELTEENEKLNERLDREARCQYDLCGQIVNLRDDVKYIKAETAQKMQGRFKERLDITTCGYSTEEVVSDVFDTIDRVAEEILEENNV